MKQVGGLRYTIVCALGGLALAACGGGQSVDRVGWDSALDAIPSDATWGVFADLRAEEVEAMAGAVPASLQTLIDTGAGELLAEFEAATGIDPMSPDALEQTGIDLTGEFAVFSTSVAPVALIRLSDEAAFLRVVDRVIDYHPDLEVQDVEIAGGPMRRLLVEDWQIDVGARDGWGVVRVVMSDGTWGADDAALLEVLRGHGDGGFASSAIARDLYGRARGDEAVSSVVFARTGLVDEVAALVSSNAMSADALDAMGLTGAADEEPACRQASARMQQMWPWIGGIEFATEGRVGWQRAEYVAHLDRATADRLRPAFRGALAPPDDLLDNAVWFGSLDVDLRTLVDAFEGDAATSSCRGLGALSGGLAWLVDEQARLIDYNLGFVDGGFAMALLDVRLAGFLPFVEAVTMIGSDNPTALFEEAQALIEDAGATGTPDTSAPLTTVDYQLMHLAIEAIRTDDRNVFAVGDVPRALTNALATDLRAADGGIFGRMRLNGARMADVLDEMGTMLGNTGSLPPDALAELQRAAAQMRAVDRIDGELRIEADGVVLEMTSEYDMDALIEAMGQP